MRKIRPLVALLSPATLLIASCSSAQSGDSAPAPASEQPFAIEAKGTFDEPWATAFAPGTQVLFITEKRGTMKFVDLASGRLGTVTGPPEVAYGGQGGLGDVAFLESESAPTLGRRTIYLSWAEQADGSARNAALGKGKLVCEEADACRNEGLQVI
jgi:glucose/arabinose dehydrogenase